MKKNSLTKDIRIRREALTVLENNWLKGVTPNIPGGDCVVLRNQLHDILIGKSKNTQLDLKLYDVKVWQHGR